MQSLTTFLRPIGVYLIMIVILVCLLTDELLSAEIGGFRRFYELTRSSANRWIVITSLSIGMSGLYAFASRRFSVEHVLFLFILCHSIAFADSDTTDNYILLLAALLLFSAVRTVVNGKNLWVVAILTMSVPIFALVCSLLGLTFDTSGYVYYGIHRLTGIWKNPNNFGVLMAVALTLTVGLVDVISSTVQKRTSRAAFYFAAFVCGGILFYFLVFSLSRGAWLAAVAGSFYLAFCFLKSRLGSNRKWHEPFALVLLIGTGSLVAVIWTTRSVEVPLARRLGSIANPYDFSGANRVAANSDALRLISMKPCLGHGWSESLKSMMLHSPFNRESAIAIHTNSFLRLAIAMGLPSLFLLLLLIARCLFPPEHEDVKVRGFTVACRAGVLATTVGFWFNGGMLATPLWAVFWMLLAVGSHESNMESAPAVAT